MVAHSSFGPSDHHMIALKGDLTGNNNLDNWNDFIGHTSGWDSDDVTEYSGEVVVTNYISSPAFQDITLNSTARSDIQNNNVFAICFVDHTYDYLNVAPSSAEERNGLYFVDNSGTSQDPYIDYTVATGYANEVSGVVTANIDSVIGVATANIGQAGELFRHRAA